MGCPWCCSEKLKEVASSVAGNAKRRRFECEDCGGRFTTVEHAEKTALRIGEVFEGKTDVPEMR